MGKFKERGTRTKPMYVRAGRVRESFWKKSAVLRITRRPTFISRARMPSDSLLIADFCGNYCLLGSNRISFASRE